MVVLQLSGEAEPVASAFTGLSKNPFSEVAALDMSSSSDDEDETTNNADEGDDDSSSHSDSSSSQIVPWQHRPRQRVRLLATFRLPSLHCSAGAERRTGVQEDSMDTNGHALQIFRPSRMPSMGRQANADAHALSTTATVVHTFQGDVPRMVVLDRDTDLNIPPPDWGVSSAKGALRPCGPAQQLIASATPESDSLAMTDALATLVGLGAETTDFVASSSTMKTIFGLACSNASVSVAVHRVDKMLVLNGIINGEARPRGSEGEASISETCGQKKLSQREKRKQRAARADATPGRAEAEEPASLYSKFMYYSASAADDPAEPALEKEIRDGLVQEGLPTGAGRLDEDGSRPSHAHPHTHAQTPGRQVGQAPDEALQSWEGMQGGGGMFRRAVHFQFHDLKLLLGSDTVIFNHGVQGNQVSLRLQEMESEVPKMTCLGYWLDNIFNQVSQTAVCYHKEGLVHGYQLVRTQDLPAWSGFAFEPKAVMETASSILHFLQTHCTKEAGTYWLCRAQGSDEIQLFCLDDADKRQRSALSQPMGLLCFKIARRLQLQDREACAAGGSCKQRQRTARLFCDAIAVLDETVHPKVVALSHEGLADAMVGAEWAAPQPPLRGDCSEAEAEPDREAEFYVDENGDLQDARPQAGPGDDDDTARPSVGDTAKWGAAYSLADLENAESHYLEAATVRGLATTAEEDSSRASGSEARGDGDRLRAEDDAEMCAVSRRLRCKASKCAIAIGIRLLRKKGAVAESLIKAVNAYDRCVRGKSREEQEVVSEAMELWADIHVALAAMTREQVLVVRAQVREIQEEERLLWSGVFDLDHMSSAFEQQREQRTDKQTRRDMTPLSHPLSHDVEDNCNHAIRYLIRSLQFCNASGRRTDLTTKLASVYTQLGAHYIRMGRFTRAHQHLQQGTQLFQSIGDEQSAASLSFKLGRLFAARAHAAPIAAGLSAEQLTDLVKARALVQQAYKTLHALALPPLPAAPARAQKALKDLVSQTQEELADIDMAIGVGKLHATGGAAGGGRAGSWVGKTGSSLVVGGGAGAGSGAGEEEVLVEEESADKALLRALATYEALNLPQATAAHLHLALYMARVEGEAAAMAQGAKNTNGNAASGRAGALLSDASITSTREQRAAALRAVKTWRQRSERHLQQAAALARTLAESVRVGCIRAELCVRRGTLVGLVTALDSLLQLPEMHCKAPCRRLQSSSSPAPPRNDGGAAHFGDAMAGVNARLSGELARWAPFDGGWGASVPHAEAEAQGHAGQGSCAEEDAIWSGVQRQTKAVLLLLVRRKPPGQEGERCKALFRYALELSQQHAGKRFMQLLAAHYAQVAKTAPRPADKDDDGAEEENDK